MATATIITESMMANKKCFADNPPKEILWNDWQYKLLKKIANGIHNAEVIWCYNEKYGKIGKTIFLRHQINYYFADKYHRDLRFLGRMLDELKDIKQSIRSIIIELPYSIDMNCRVHCIDALRDIEEYIIYTRLAKIIQPIVIILAPRKADKILGLDFDITFETMCLREIPLPIFSDSLPAEELIHMYNVK